LLSLEGESSKKSIPEAELISTRKQNQKTKALKGARANKDNQVKIKLISAKT
jgi:hypothetical protein